MTSTVDEQPTTTPPTAPPTATVPSEGAASDDVDLFCPGCGYHLRGIEGIDCCPECGLAIDRTGVALSQIPWAHRRHIGRFRAYWRTVWLASLNPRKLAAESARRVGYRDAQRFRMITAVLAAAPIIAGVTAAFVLSRSAGMFTVLMPSAIPGWAMYGNPTPSLDVLIPWEAGMTLYPMAPLAVLLLCILITGVHTYWFHPRRLPVVRQNRAVALAYYACAPLALSPVPVLLFAAVTGMNLAGLDDSAKESWVVVRILAIAFVLTTLAVITLTWRSMMTLLSRTTQSGVGRLLVAGALIPVEWILCAGLALVAVPWVIGFVRLVISSLR
jgi:hypothetical protein